jgi:hypothetical protein
MTVVFGFGNNWVKFAADLKEEQIVEAQASLQKLLGRGPIGAHPPRHWIGRRALFACGPLGARVHSFDSDPNSVACTQSCATDTSLATAIGRSNRAQSWMRFGHHSSEHSISCILGAFCTTPAQCGQHWSSLRRWLDRAERSPSHSIEEQPYAGHGVSRSAFVPLFRFSGAEYGSGRSEGLIQSGISRWRTATGRSPIGHVRGYKTLRGMNWHRDVHDWLGGYPYESASSEQVTNRLGQLGISIIRAFQRRAGLGFFGTGCDEYVCRRRLTAPQSK